jgi:hypothetical protein
MHNSESMVWRAEVIPDELPSPKQKMIAAWDKLQDMALVCQDLGWEAKTWMYIHPEETRNIKYAAAVGLVSLLSGMTVVYGAEWLSNLKISK